MDISEAVDLIRGITYKPGWTFTAIPHGRYDGTIELRIRYTVYNSNNNFAPSYSELVHPVPIMGFYLQVNDCRSEIDLYGKVLECLLQIERHETREFFGVNGEAYEKPFHPHTIPGMNNWAERRNIVELEDITLGVMAYS